MHFCAAFGANIGTGMTPLGRALLFGGANASPFATALNFGGQVLSSSTGK